jgi:tetratricopeptide (TPR) repeat protein
MFYHLDMANAEREFIRAIELNPKDEFCYELYSYLLLSMGRLGEGLRMAQRGLEVAPFSPVLTDDVASALYLAHRYDEAISQYQRSLELDPDHYGALFGLGLVFETKGMHDEAIRQLEKSIAVAGRTPGVLAMLGRVQASSGRKAEAQKLLGEINVMSQQTYVSPYDMAILYVGLGEKDKAIEQLNKAYEERAGWIIYLKIEPIFDPIRDDPRVKDLIARMKL